LKIILRIKDISMQKQLMTRFRKNKKPQVIYTVRPGSRYLISNVKFQKDSSLVNKEIQDLSVKHSLKINPFDLDVIK
jgi:outer membrane protein assembly factor BamA